MRDEHGEFLEGTQSMGILNAMKTGNLHLDMIIAMCIPVVLRMLFSLFNIQRIDKLVQKVKDWLMGYQYYEGVEWYTRTIKHAEEKDRHNNFNSLDDDVKNEILIKAITMYLQHLQCIQLQHADIKLTSLQQGDDDGDYDDYYYDSDDSDDDEVERFSNKLSSYKIVQNPPNEEWHPTGCMYPDKKKKNRKSTRVDDTKNTGKTTNGDNKRDTADPTAMEKPNKTENEEEGGDILYEVEIKIKESEQRASNADDNGNTDNNNNNKSSNHDRRYVEYRLRSMGRDSVDQFLDEAYEWYVSEIKRREDRDKCRYYYDLKEGDYSGEGDEHQYKRYKLSDDKNFDSLFFPERETIVRLLGHFLNKTGKYGIAGYPYKLGLLLHGPPGTGKTSLIKAIAQYTNRSIINIPLARIKTNAELNRLFFSDEYKYDGAYYPSKMTFKDVIFVMEDIDAASKVVQRRDGKLYGKRTTNETQTAQVELPVPKSMWRLLLESQGNRCIELVETLVTKSERLQENATSSETLKSMAERMSSIPGLSVVGHPVQSQTGAATIRKIASDALKDGDEMMEGSRSLTEYLDFHAKSILKLLEMGAEVDEAFENELLGLTAAANGSDDNHRHLAIPRPGVLSRDVSYNKYEGQETTQSCLEVETIDRTTHALGKLAARSSPPPLSADVPIVGLGDGLGVSGTMTMAGGLMNGPDDFALGGVTGKTGQSGQGLGVTGSAGGLGLGGYGGYGFGGGGGACGGLKGGLGGGLAGFAHLRDELNLSGMLNVLDGVVDTPGRIVIMTTNHPEKLDPALIRPGRIDKKLILGSMKANDVVKMLQHYFQLELDDAQKDRVHKAVDGDGSSNRPALSLTPAQVEQLTAEYDDIQEMITALEAKGNPIISITGPGTTEKTQSTPSQESATNTITTITKPKSRIMYESSCDWSPSISL